MSEQTEIREAPTGGLGAFARTNIKQGALIVEETTVMVSTHHLPGPKSTWRDVMLNMRDGNLEARYVEEALKGLSETKIDEFRASYADATSDLHRFHVVSYDICPVFGGPPTAFAATSVGPYMNHSCVGNLQYSWDEASRTVHLRALEGIAAGDQLCLCYYLDDEWMDTEARRAELHLIYDFSCGCPVCSDAERSALSDERRSVIRKLQTRLEHFAASKPASLSAQEASQDADRYVELVEQEIGGVNEINGLPYRADVRLATAYRLAAKCKEHLSDTQRLRQKATTISQICFGPDSPHVAMQDYLFEKQFNHNPKFDGSETGAANNET